VFRKACCVGHEIIGNVVRVGKNVKKINVGDRVGVGPQAWSCDRPDCEECSSGRSNYCPRAVSTYNSSFPNDEGQAYGGYSTYHRTNGRFAVKIPDGVASEDAAPMLCAGITLYSPLKKHGCGPGKKVGIIGLGGLGHFGILFSKALEADRVVAISRSSSKKDDAIALGADEYIAMADDSEWANKHAGSLDLVVVTASGTNLPVNDYLKLLKVGGTLLQLGFVPIPFPYRKPMLTCHE
jgi:alcohol dehydrogenase (NADP+)